MEKIEILVLILIFHRKTFTEISSSLSLSLSIKRDWNDIEFFQPAQQTPSNSYITVSYNFPLNNMTII